MAKRFLINVEKKPKRGNCVKMKFKKWKAYLISQHVPFTEITSSIGKGLITITGIINTMCNEK